MLPMTFFLPFDKVSMFLVRERPVQLEKKQTIDIVT